MIFNLFKRKKPSESQAVELYLSNGSRATGRSIAWLEACITEGKVREDKLQLALSSRIRETDSQQLALRLAYDFLYTNSEMHSHAGRVCHILRRVLRGRTQMAGSEHALRAGIEAGHSPSNENLGIC